MTISEQQIKEFSNKNINTLGNGVDIDVLYKYWPYNTVLDVLKNKELVFVNPAYWENSFEKIYLDTDYTELGFKQPKIYSICFSTTIENEQTDWKIYSKNNHTLRCQINIDVLLEILSEFAEKNGFLVYMGKTNYDLSKTEIQSLHLPKGKYFNKYFDDFSVEKYLEIMLLKPKTLKHENEFRIFIVPKPRKKYIKGMLKIPIPDEKFQLLFSNFTIQEFEVKFTDDYSRLGFEISINESIKKSWAEKIKLLYNNASVENYIQFKNHKPIKKITLKSRK